MSSALDVGKKLTELCNQGKFTEAMNALYSPKIVSLEAQSGPSTPARLEGIDAVREKAEWWDKNHIVHSAKTAGPWPHGDRFIVCFTLDFTPKVGPMAGKRLTMDEAALYTVSDGKIVQEEFFYRTGE